MFNFILIFKILSDYLNTEYIEIFEVEFTNKLFSFYENNLHEKKKSKL